MDKLMRLENKLYTQLLALGFDIRSYDRDTMRSSLKAAVDTEQAERASATSFLDKTRPVSRDLASSQSKRQKLIEALAGSSVGPLSKEDVEELEQADDLMTISDAPTGLLSGDVAPDRLNLFSRALDKMGANTAHASFDSGADRLGAWRVRGEILATLKPYQTDGLRHIISQFDKGVGAVLAHGCGLGKTVTSLATIKVVSETNERIGLTTCALILVPKSVTRQWIREQERFESVIDLQMYPLFECHNESIASMVKAWQRYGGAAVCSHTQFLLDKFEPLRAAIDDDTIVVLDEAHQCKNSSTLLYKSLFSMRAKRRILLTGTPMQNQLTEYFHLLNLADPGRVANNAGHFKDLYVKPIENGKFRDASPENIEKSLHTVRVLQASARVVMHDRNALHELSRVLAPKHDFRISHDAPSSATYGQTYGQKGNATQRWDYLNSVRDVKVQLTVALIQKISAGQPDDRILVFSHSNLTLEALREKLAPGICAGLFVGKTADTERDSILKTFATSSARVLLIGTLSGGVGLQLEMANRVIFMDVSWNPMNDAQAVARSYRIGQTKSVSVYRLVGKDTIEDRIYRVGVVKKIVSAWLMDEESTKNPYTKEQIDTFGVEKEEQESLDVGTLVDLDPAFAAFVSKMKVDVYDHDALQEEFSHPTQLQRDLAQNDLNANNLKKMQRGDAIVKEKPLLWVRDDLVSPFPPVIRDGSKERATTVRVRSSEYDDKDGDDDECSSLSVFSVETGCAEFDEVDENTVKLQVLIQTDDAPQSDWVSFMADNYVTKTDTAFPQYSNKTTTITVHLDSNTPTGVPLRAYAQYVQIDSANTRKINHFGPLSPPSAPFQILK